MMNECRCPIHEDLVLLHQALKRVIKCEFLDKSYPSLNRLYETLQRDARIALYCIRADEKDLSILLTKVKKSRTRFLKHLDGTIQAHHRSFMLPWAANLIEVLDELADIIFNYFKFHSV